MFEDRTEEVPSEWEYIIPYDSEFIIASQIDMYNFKLYDVYSTSRRLRIANECGSWNDTFGLKLPEMSIYYRRLDMNQTKFKALSLNFYKPNSYVSKICIL